MAQKVYLRTNTTGRTHLGNNSTSAAGAATTWKSSLASTSPGAAAVNNYVDTVTGPTSGLEVGISSFFYTDPSPFEFISEPLSADFTISGTVTFNIWGLESAMTNNAGFRVIVERLDSQLNIASTIVASTRGTELGTVNAVNNWTATPTSTNMLRGDRLRIRVIAIDTGGTMAAASQGVTMSSDGPTTAAAGDTYVQFNENLTFETTDPSGTQLFLTTTSAGIDPGSAIENEAWTSRGSGSTNSVTNTRTGYAAATQVTASAGGTSLEWYTKQLNSFTLGGKTKCNIRASESNIAANSSIGVEIAICNSDGSSPTVWGYANREADTGGGQIGEIATSDTAYSVWVAGDDTAVSNGQRLRIRVFIEDCANAAMVASHTVTLTYAGTFGGVSGDSYVILPQSVTEFVGSAAEDVPTYIGGPVGYYQT